MQEHLDRLTSTDASFLHQEGHASHMHIGGVLIFEGSAPDFDEFADHIRGRLHLGHDVAGAVRGARRHQDYLRPGEWLDFGDLIRRAFIQHEPIQSQLASGLCKVIKIYRLTNVTVHAKLIASHHISLCSYRSRDNLR